MFFENKDIQGLTLNIRMIEKKLIEKLYTITPILMKYRNSFYKWFYLNDEAEVKKILEKYI